MHRLSRQVACTTRLFRPRPRKAFSPLSSCRRHYATPNRLWKDSPEELAKSGFKELYDLFTPDLEKDVVVKLGAALMTRAKDDEQIDQAIAMLEDTYPDLNQEELHNEITLLMESVDSKLSSGSTKTVPKSAEGRYQVSEHHELGDVIETREAQEAISKLSETENDKLQELMLGIMSTEEGVDVSSMRQIGELLGKYGLKMDVIDNSTADPVVDAKYQQRQFMTEEQAELARQRAKAEANPLTQTQEEERRPYPNLMSADPLMDSRDVLELPPTPETPYHNRVVVRNHTSMFHEAMALDGFNFDDPRWEPTKTDLSEEEITLNESAGIDSSVNNQNFYIFPLVQRWTTQQTGKGKIKHFQVFLVTGDGNGMVGLGIGVDEEREMAFQKARIDALKKLDYVDRFENRTIWTDMKSKFRSTEIIMRPRPTGFGLRCGPIMHQVLKAAGIKDISGKVWGSRNPVMIMQGLMKMLHGGHAPLGMGNGIGGKGKRLAKGSGMRTQFDVERDRGRKLVNIRK